VSWPKKWHTSTSERSAASSNAKAEAARSHFKSSWTMLYNAAKSGQRPAGMSIRAYLADAISLCRKLDSQSCSWLIYEG
jgi:hypothetical protein